MKNARRYVLLILALLIIIFNVALYLPMFIFYGGFGLLDPFAVRERYTMGYYVYAKSYEPFENLTALIPVATLGSEELLPTNAETIKIGNQTYIKLHKSKPRDGKIEVRRGGRIVSVVVYIMDFSVEFPEVKLENLSDYGIDRGSPKVLVNFSNASWVELGIQLQYWEYDYVDIFGKRIYTNFGHYNYLYCKALLNVTSDDRNRWISIPAICQKPD